jgi:hypothetical protein
MIAPASPQSAGPAFILNGHSVHVEEAEAHITQVSQALALRRRSL